VLGGAGGAYNVALLNGGMGDIAGASQLLHVDQSALVYNNLAAVPLGVAGQYTHF